jgi:DNA modification methylase
MSWLMWWFFIGNSITACKRIDRHVVGMEGDKKIFEALLKPMISLTQSPPIPSAPLLSAKKPKRAAAVKRRRVEDPQ